MVSIIIPCYNQGAFIQEAIDSVKAQTYADWEIIIVDDGSDDDNTIVTLKQIDGEKIKIKFQDNQGVSVARNFGAENAQGEYLLFLDGDDKIASEYLELASKAFNSYPDLSYVYCDVQEFGETNNYRILESLDIKKTLIYNQTHVSAIFKRSLWDATKGFDKSFKKGWEDWDFIIRILEMGVLFYKIPKPMLLYRIRKNSRDKTAVNLHESFLLNQIYLKHIDSYIKYFESPLQIFRMYYNQQIEILDLKQNAVNIYSTHSYKLGSLLLSPFKLMKKVFVK